MSAVAVATAVKVANAKATLASLARSKKRDQFEGVLKHDPVDQTPAVWRAAPECDNA